MTIENLKAKLEAKEAELVQSLDALEQDLSDLSQVYINPFQSKNI